MLTATVGVQPPILDTFPRDAEDVRASLSKQSNLNYSILEKKKDSNFFFLVKTRGPLRTNKY